MDPIDKYFSLKSAMDQAWSNYNANPTKRNSTAYGIALSEYTDHCVNIVEKMVSVAPGMLDMIDKLKVGDK